MLRALAYAHKCTSVWRHLCGGCEELWRGEWSGRGGLEGQWIGHARRSLGCVCTLDFRWIRWILAQWVLLALTESAHVRPVY